MTTLEMTQINQLSFEEALKQLEIIVKKLESGQTGLESAITDYELGTALKQHCEKKLHEAKLKVEKITKDTAGVLGVVPFDDVTS